MSRAIEDLLHEHEAIEFALNILTNMTGKLESSSPVDPADLTAFIGFLKEFADKCHHGKEEGLLFPALATVDVQEAGAPLAELLREHEEGREWIAAMWHCCTNQIWNAIPQTPDALTPQRPSQDGPAG